MVYRYILDGHRVIPCDNLLIWAKWIETADRTVKLTDITKDIYVSTVFLGLDFSYSRDGIPKLFETMVFGGVKDRYIERYMTWEEAERGHDIVVEEIRRTFTYIMVKKK